MEDSVRIVIYCYLALGFILVVIALLEKVVMPKLSVWIATRSPASTASKRPLNVSGPPAPEGFFDALGKYHAIWQGLDLVIDFAIGALTGLDEPSKLASVRSNKISFGTKIRQLKDLVEASKHRDKGAIIAAIWALDRAYRSELTHSYLASSCSAVRFIYGGNQDGAKPCSITFSGPQFIEHVAQFSITAKSLQNLLGLDSSELVAFSERALDNAPPCS
ncbi:MULTISPECIES: hypothetical protein [unclassified Bradyrhizobium]|uniref:hypothetical protein n=1 Tax=unclassified Bradyrhizobium TaxID=2631580 RepID=UPI00247AFC87|nr:MULTISPECIES: hypothetical protein [unclassified Bradyrhizobium]WGS22844.1 hypothetical protein MTX22_15000 [Bradyrhizobium sp. ISRA463]WGS29837.1 hypothetical protein MTX19_12745 [Bradyrhizobium sp. ISRA464]